jgi:hypothetical protein
VKFRTNQASAILMALLLIAMAGVLTAGALSVLMARSGMVEQMTTASQRRLALENSKALAQEFMLQRVMTSSAGSTFEYSLSPPSLGGITMSAWSSPPMQSTAKVDDVNHFDPGNGDGYKMDVTATVSDGESNFERKYIVKSRSPVLAGTLLTLQAPASGSISTSAVDVDGDAFVWQPVVAMTFTPDSYSVPDTAAATTVTFQNSAGSTLMAPNLALPRQITNPRSGLQAPYIYSGEFDAIRNNNAAANSSYAKVIPGAPIVNGSTPDSDGSDGIICNGTGTVTITLATLELGNVFIEDVGTLVLEGQATAYNSAADIMSAILIVVDQTGAGTLLNTITLNNHNSRRVAVAVKSTPSTTTSTLVQFVTGTANWRLLLELENTPIRVTSPGIATIRGGIRSDRAVNLDTSSITGGLRLTLDSDPKYLERLATRTAWIESYTQ